MLDAFLQTLEEKIKGLLYYSESDNPYTVEMLKSTSLTEVLSEIASLSNVAENEIKVSDAQVFFDHIIQAADPGDPVLQANAGKTKELYDYLQSNLTSIKVYRVKSGARVSIYIVGTGKDKMPVTLKTEAIET